MPIINKSALVSYDANDMFNIVDDIESYPEFLPWCGAASVASRNDDEVQASIEISHSGINKTFTTRNRLQKGKMIEVQLVNGPFKHLHGFWQFKKLGENACKVSLELEYEFSSKLVGLVIGPIFGQIAGSLVDAFCKRAEELYGKK
ncbi:MAG TPA: type II toxin-antitoxin system RatA family toxin [Gammaproteobacteria bacterium]